MDFDLYGRKIRWFFLFLKISDEELNNEIFSLIGDMTGISKLKAAVNYDYRDLKSATQNFSTENKLGEGGFGAVYKVTMHFGFYQNFVINHV